MTEDDRLAAIFAALTAEDDDRQPPFRWQMRFLRRLLDGDLPKAVDIPTGLGKTAVMALWLIALAEGARLPRRLVYVVDRRAVVDQATRFAERLRRNMPAELAERLRLDGGAGALSISTLRGGFADNRDWLEDPSRPAVVVGTIDMIGSRLLFEGYGVSRGMRPYHAGFLGVDTLVLLDEAHLCPPFEALLRQIEAHRDGKLGPAIERTPVAPPFHLMSLSATGREVKEVPPNAVFRLEEQDREEPVVHQRLTAGKRLQVTELGAAESLPARITESGGSPSSARRYGRTSGRRATSTCSWNSNRIESPGCWASPAWSWSCPHSSRSARLICEHLRIRATTSDRAYRIRRKFNMRKDDEIRLRHMLDAGREAVSFAHGRVRSDLDTHQPSRDRAIGLDAGLKAGPGRAYTARTAPDRG